MSKKTIETNESFDEAKFLPIDFDLQLQPPKHYVLDFDKINTLEDVINVLKGLNIKGWWTGNQIPEDLKGLIKEVK